MKVILKIVVLTILMVLPYKNSLYGDENYKFSKQQFYNVLETYSDGVELSPEEIRILKGMGVFSSDENELDDFGGPDLFGYYYKDSDEPDGPDYNWIDITDTGEEIDEMDDDDYQGPFPLPFEFSFYGNEYDEIYICSNGYLTFCNGYNNYWGMTTPSPDTPNNALYFFADDLNPENGGTIYYGEDEEGNWICTFEEIEEYWNGPGQITAQVVLSPDGSILYQYEALEYEIDINNECIGIENSDGTDGLEASIDDTPFNYPYEGLAIRFTLGEEEASVSGIITDEMTGLPISGAEVQFEEYTGITNDLGEYSIEQLQPRLYNVSISVEGYHPYFDDVTITAGENFYDASLVYPGTLVIDPPEAYLNAINGESNSQAITFYNTGFSDLSVVLSNGQDIEGQVLRDRYVPTYPLRTSSPFLAAFLTQDMPSSNDTDAFPITPSENYRSELDDPQVLIFQDSRPWWQNNSHQDYLEEIGVAFDVYGSDEMQDIDFDLYTLIMIPSCQNQNFYNTFADNFTRFENWISSGGWLEFHGCTQGAEWELWNGLYFEYDTSDTNTVVNPDHPITNNIPEVFTGNFASHGYMEDIPENSAILIEDENGNPVLIEFGLDAGNVIVTAQTWEYGVHANQVAGDVMLNCIDYTTANAPGTHLWLFYEPVSFTIEPGDSVEVTITGDASAEEISEGVYETVLFAESDDPVNQVVQIPVIFEVVPQLVISIEPEVDPAWVGPNGGIINWNASVENISNSTVVFDAWTEVITPGGNVVSPVAMLPNLDADPGEILQSSPVIQVPLPAPNGIYSFIAKVGNYPDAVAQDGFDFAKLPLLEQATTSQDVDWDGFTVMNFMESSLGIDEESGLNIPTEIFIEPAYPNPANPTATFSINLVDPGEIKISVYNINGQLVSTIFDGLQQAGSSVYEFDGERLASGIYFLSINYAGKVNKLRKLALIR